MDMLDILAMIFSDNKTAVNITRDCVKVGKFYYLGVEKIFSQGMYEIDKKYKSLYCLHSKFVLYVSTIYLYYNREQLDTHIFLLCWDP